MSEIINLRRARKAKVRAKEKAKVPAQSTSVNKKKRSLAKMQNAKIARDLDACKLDRKPQLS